MLNRKCQGGSLGPVMDQGASLPVHTHFHGLAPQLLGEKLGQVDIGGLAHVVHEVVLSRAGDARHRRGVDHRTRVVRAQRRRCGEQGDEGHGREEVPGLERG